MSSRKIVPTTTNPTTVLHVTVAAIPANLPTYDRDDWKHWTDADGDCQNARNEALIAESRVSVSYRTDRRCRVATGEWRAPYTGTIVTDPSGYLTTRRCSISKEPAATAHAAVA